MADGKGPLPDRWRVAGLYVHGMGTFKVEPGQRTTDEDIKRADAIIVSYRGRTGTEVFRTVHGAKSKTQLGKIISTQTRKVSPVRKGRG